MIGFDGVPGAQTTGFFENASNTLSSNRTNRDHQDKREMRFAKRKSPLELRVKRRFKRLHNMPLRAVQFRSLLVLLPLQLVALHSCERAKRAENFSALSKRLRARLVSTHCCCARTAPRSLARAFVALLRNARVSMQRHYSEQSKKRTFLFAHCRALENPFHALRQLVVFTH